MISRGILAAALFAALLSAGPAAAGRGHTGHSLHNLCKTSRPVCIGYISAVVDIMESTGYVHGFRACIPRGIGEARFAEVVARWLAARPRQRGQPADRLVARILAEAFPCR